MGTDEFACNRILPNNCQSSLTNQVNEVAMEEFKIISLAFLFMEDCI